MPPMPTGTYFSPYVDGCSGLVFPFMPFDKMAIETFMVYCFEGVFFFFFFFLFFFFVTL